MHKHKSKSKSRRWGDWSEWYWDGTQQTYMRVRQDAEGYRDYEYDQRDVQPASHAWTPRDAAVEDITDRLNSLSPIANEAQPEEYAYGDVPPDESKPKKGKSKGKEKGKSHRKHSSSEGEASTTQHEGVAYSESPALQYVESTYNTEYQPQHQPEYQGQFHNERLSGYQQEIPQSHVTSVNYSKYGSVAASYSSARRYGAFAGETEGSSSQAAATPFFSEEDHETEHTVYVDVYSGSEGSPTPQPEATQDDGYMLANVEDEPSVLDPRFRLRHSKDFEPGAIFKVHWSEPQGSSNERSTSSSKKQQIQSKFGTEFFVGFRRFIVIANDQGHCACVPILTYGGKACKKHGVKPEKHGIVHEYGTEAKRLDGEPSMGFRPVRVIMKEGERISKDSRVNYSKLVTVEHNVKVFLIGHVCTEDWQIAQDAVNHCWNKKIHQKQRHR